MKLATIVVLVITAAFLAFCVWIERHSRSQERAQNSSRSTDDHRHANRRPWSGTERAEQLMKGSSTKASLTSEAAEP
jgi:Flp pilus assembly protein TadB